jgi:hypothetical protein
MYLYLQLRLRTPWADPSRTTRRQTRLCEPRSWRISREDGYHPGINKKKPSNALDIHFMPPIYGRYYVTLQFECKYTDQVRHL